jgi:hypothetical protein
MYRNQRVASSGGCDDEPMTEREGLFEMHGRMLIASLRQAGMDDPTIRQMCSTGAWEWLLDLKLTETTRQEILGFFDHDAVLRSLVASAAVRLLAPQP